MRDGVRLAHGPEVAAQQRSASWAAAAGTSSRPLLIRSGAPGAIQGQGTARDLRTGQEQEKFDRQAMQEQFEKIYADRLVALGHLIERSAYMEATLRDVFCTLVGSKYGAVVAAGPGGLQPRPGCE